MKFVFSDFDGTLTKEHSLSPVFFEILDLLKKNNCKLVIVSGRSLSWGHFFLTHFHSIEACIMEGGAVLVKRKKNGLMEEKNLIDDAHISHLESSTKELILQNPWVHLSIDSFGRRADRAIELCEYNDDEKNKIFEFLRSKKINFSCSNVHINFWSGEISKYKAVEYYLKTYFSDVSLDDCIYFGDAPNDESMFKFFKNSVGVSNIAPYLSQINHKPQVILTGNENNGPYGVLNHLKTLFS